jgi:prepilin-type N-terminal cleavage/methylation domain-containing protein
MNYKLRTNKGFTLTEAMMAMVILALAVTGILLPFTTGAAVRAEGMHKTLAAKLAADLMEEIINTLTSQYDGYVYSEPQGQIKGADDTVFTDSNYAKFSRTVTCEQRIAPAGAKFILVTVRVCYNDREMAAVNRLISQ